MRLIAALVLAGIAIAGLAQWKEDFLREGSGGFVRPSNPTVAGQAASDLLPGNGSGFGYALRYAGIVPDTERVSVNGKPLVRDQDYQVDYPSGTLVFFRPVRTHESVQITYRHADSLAGKAAGVTMPLMSMKLGQTGAIRGLFAVGGAERLSDGSIRQRLSYGLANRFQIGQGLSLNGMYFMSSQQGMQAFADPSSPDKRQGATQKDELDHFINQGMDFRQSGLRFNVNYTDIGRKFNGFDAMQTDGIAGDQIGKWQKEKGITRLGYGFGYGQSGTDFEANYSKISDGVGNVERRGLQFKSGGTSFYWNTRWVDPTFTRFNDLAEGGEAQQWAKEKGIYREGMGAAMKFAGGSLKFDDTSIRDAGGEVHRTDISLDAGMIKATHYDQQIDTGFTRFNDLAEGERGQWAKERGFHRSGQSFQIADLYHRKDVWNTYVEDRIDTAGGDLVRRSAQVSGLGFGLIWSSTNVDTGFGGLPSLRPDETQGMIREIRASYNKDDAAVTDKDRQFLLRQTGIERDYKRFSLTQKFGTLAIDTLSISADAGDIRRTRFGLANKAISFDYLDQEIGTGFNRMSDLLDSERALYANEVGMRRRQWGAALGIGKAGQLRLNGLDIGSQDGGLRRYSLALQTGNYQITANLRDVDETFRRSGDLSDPEKQLLNDLRGSTQNDISAKVRLFKNLNIEMFHFGSDDHSVGVDRNQTKYFLTWSPDGKTNFSHLNDRLRADSPTTSLNDYMHEKTTYERSFGKLGKFSGFSEREYAAGTLVSGVDKTLGYWKYEGSPISGFGLVAESLNISDSSGNTEVTQLRSITGQVDKRTTLTISEKTIDRDEKRADEVHRTYGIGHDFGKGVKFDWTYTRALNSAGNGRALQSWSLSKSTFGFLEVSAGYNEDRVDVTNTKAAGQFGVKSVKPMRLGPLSNVAFAFGYQSLAEQTVWKQETKLGSVTADWGTNKLGWTYGGVMTPTGDRAVDRAFSFATNPDAKLPFHLAVNYKIRTLPGGVQQIIRNYHLDYKVGDKLTLVHDLTGNPEKGAENVPFSTVINPTGTSNWALSYKLSKTHDLIANYLTAYDFTKAQMARKGGLTLASKTPTGLNLWSIGYGLEASNINGQSSIAHTVTVGYSYNINPQNAISFSVSDTQYQHNIPFDRDRNYVTGRMDYTLRF